MPQSPLPPSLLPGDDAETPVFLLTGFLGSGKTTILRTLLRDPRLADTAVIVNEFGAVGLDHMLVSRGEEDNVVLLDNGCLCCALNSSIGETLTDLFHRRSRGEIPAFSRVVIETTGMADPIPIMQALFSDRFIASRYGIAAIIAAVDGELALGQLDRHRESRRQAAVADRIIITKRDRIDGERLDRLRQHLSGLNPRAEILAASHGDIAPDVTLAPVAAPRPLPLSDLQHDHAHEGSVTTLYLPVPDPVSWADYAAMISYFQSRYGERLLRVKGLLRFAGEPELQVIQGVQYIFAQPQSLDGASPGSTGLVLIGEGLDRAALATDLAAFGVRLDP